MKNVGRDQLVLDKIFGAQLFIPDCEVLEHEKCECLAKFFTVSGGAQQCFQVYYKHYLVLHDFFLSQSGGAYKKYL